MTDVDLLRTQTKDLLDSWEDSDGDERDALLRMLPRHLTPTRMADTDQSVKAKITGGPAPWDDPVAHLLADIASGTRTIERGLDIAVGNTIRIRGGSDGNTRHALGRIPDLVDQLGARDADGLFRDLTAEARITIGAWHRAALLLLGAERRWAHIRSRDDDGNLIVATCPYCASPVRVQPDVADEGDPQRHLPGRSVTSYGTKPTAVCVNRDCWEEDDQGNRYRRAWDVDPWLGQLLTWTRDIVQRRAS